MQVSNFKDFISEAKKPEKFRLLIISDEPENDKNFHTAKNLLKQAEKLGTDVSEIGVAAYAIRD